MKLTKRCLAVLLCFALLFPLLPANVFAADDGVFRLDNGYIEVSVSKQYRQPMQRRISSLLPVAALRTHAGSAMCPRPTPT